MSNKTNFFLVFCIDNNADIILSDTPQSRNVSAGTKVVFTCATPENGLTSFTLTPGLTLGNTIEMILPNGDRQLMLSFIAPSEYQMLTISCVATRVNNMGILEDFNTSAAVLMIQGETAFKLYPLLCTYRQHHCGFICCVFCLIIDILDSKISMV